MIIRVQFASQIVRIATTDWFSLNLFILIANYLNLRNRNAIISTQILRSRAENGDFFPFFFFFYGALHLTVIQKNE